MPGGEKEQDAMKRFLLVNLTKGTVIAERAYFANRFRERMKGLIGMERMEAGEALVLPRCGNVHTFFMAFPIDILFLDGKLRVRRISEGLKPFSISPLVLGSRYAVELPAGTIWRTVTGVGDALEFRGPFGEPLERRY